MTSKLYTPLKNRALLAISGDDARQFLQGLISNNINKLTISNAIYALMLTPQGKFLYDFFIYEDNGRILLDCNAEKINQIKQKLTMYKLRAKLDIIDVTAEYEIIVVTTDMPADIKKHGIIVADPRSEKLPFRFIALKSIAYDYLNNNGFTIADFAEYEKLRICNVIAADKDMEDAFPLEYQMDEHSAIDYSKGCYVGQEVTARTHYRGTIRKKPCLVTAENGVELGQYYGQDLVCGSSKIGVLRSGQGNLALALVRLDDLEKASGDVFVEGVRVSIAADFPLLK